MQWKSDWDWQRTSARIDWKTRIPLSQDMPRELAMLAETLCLLVQETTTEQSPSKHSCTVSVQAPMVHAQLTGDSPCHAMFVLIMQRFIPTLLQKRLIPGVTRFAWMDDPDTEPSPASKFLQRYSSLCTGYHSRIMLFGKDSKLRHQLAGSVTVVILVSKKAASLVTCWIFNETNLRPPLPPPEHSPKPLYHLWEHFGFVNALTCEDAVRIQDLFRHASVTNTESCRFNGMPLESFQKQMPPLSFSTGASECLKFVVDITNRLVRTLHCVAMHHDAIVCPRLETEDGEGISVRILFSQRRKNGQISAQVTLRPSFLMDSVPVHQEPSIKVPASSLKISFWQVTPWDVD